MSKNKKFEVVDYTIENVEDDFVVMFNECPNQDPIFLSEIGGLILNYLKEGLDISDIANKICEIYDVSIEEVTKDIVDLIKELEKVKLVKKIN